MADFAEQYINPCEDSLKSCRGLKNSLDTAREEGREEGIEIVLQVLSLLKQGKTADEIAQEAGVSEERVRGILRKLNQG
jgi:DNA-binding NarL/FixJ family response regulator